MQCIISTECVYNGQAASRSSIKLFCMDKFEGQFEHAESYAMDSLALLVPHGTSSCEVSVQANVLVAPESWQV